MLGILKAVQHGRAVTRPGFQRLIVRNCARCHKRYRRARA